MPAPLPLAPDQIDPAVAWATWKPDQDQPWNARWARHLYRRAGFGATPAEVRRALADGFEKTAERLLTGEPVSESRAALLADTGLTIARNGNPDHLRGWWAYAMLHSGHPLREKLTLFWHNHFATSIEKVRSTELMLRQNQLLRRHALGKFGPMLLEVSRDPAMLLWLDSNSNVKDRPNENYARELMELFTLGVGSYTERDVREAARAFTGWHTDPGGTSFCFHADLHDGGEKTVLGRTGNWDGGDVVRILLERPAAARFLAGKLYRAFVSEAPPPERLLGPLVEQYRSSGYDTAALMRTILTSRLFFSEHAYRKRVKSPVEFVLGAAKDSGHLPAPTDLAEWAARAGQPLFAPPNVKGWRGGRDWLNSATLLARNNFAAEVAAGEWTERAPRGTPPQLRASPTAADAASAAGVEPPPDQPPPVPPYPGVEDTTPPEAVVKVLAAHYLDGEMSPDVRDRLRAFLAEGNPKGYEFRRRVREAAHAVMCLPEYQLA